MLVIRFSRVGRHNHAQYRIIVQEKTQSPTKKHLDIVGSYDPHSKKTVLQEEKIKEYLANGAQPSDSVYNLLVRNEVITGAKRTVKLPEKKVSADTEESTEEKPEEKEGVAAEEEAVTTDEAVSADEKPKADKKEAKEEVREEKTEEKKEEKKSNDDKGSDETREDKAEKTTEKK